MRCNPTTRILVGDARDRLAEIPDDSIHCVITSPPYWGQRHYGHPDQIGLEPTWEEHMAALFVVFEEVRRVMRPDATFWLNYGDAWAGAGRTSGPGEIQDGHRSRNSDAPLPKLDTSRWPRKSRMMLASRLAIAMQEDGWIVRDDIKWAKPNPMTSSAKDRPTNAHESLFLIAKEPVYFYDHIAVQTPQKQVSLDRLDRARLTEAETPPGAPAHSGVVGLRDAIGDDEEPHRERGDVPGANLRNVWFISTSQFRGPHYATFPPDLVDKPILAGTSAHGVCAACGAPYRREPVEWGFDLTRPQTRRALEIAEENGLTEEHLAAVRAGGITDTGKTAAVQHGTGKHSPEVKRLMDEAKEVLGGYYRELLLVRPTRTDWVAGCACDADRVPATVLDPFGGAGTVGLVAHRLGRSSVLVELNEDSAALTHERLLADQEMFADITVC